MRSLDGSGLRRTTTVGVRTWGIASGLLRTSLLTLRVVAFWTAVGLPVFYPLLLLGVLPAGVLTLVDLLAVHLLTLVVGRRYGRVPTSATKG